MARFIVLLALLAPVRAGASELTFDAFASFSPRAEYGTITADTFGPDSGGPTYQLGLGGAVARRLGHRIALAGGARYDYGRASGPFAIGDDTLHVLALPLALAFVLPIGNFELAPAIALGPGLGYSPGYNGGTWMYAATTELAVTFAQRRHPGVFVQAGAKLDWLEQIGGDLEAGAVVNTQLPFVRLGATWR